MLLTKECDYSVRIIRALADGEKKKVEELCKLERIPIPYAYKILKKLQQAGLLHSLRGRSGGYQLAVSLDKITLVDVLMAIDKDLLIFECLDSNKPCLLHSVELPCSVHLELERLQDVLVAEMGRKSMHEVFFPNEIT